MLKVQMLPGALVARPPARGAESPESAGREGADGFLVRLFKRAESAERVPAPEGPRGFGFVILCEDRAGKI